jgi:hypothetical protein
MLRWVGLGLLLGAGFGTVAWGQGSGKFDGHYVGQLTLLQVFSGDCTQPPVGARYPLSITHGRVRFKYLPRFNTTLTGTIEDNGALKASARLNRGTARMTGRVDGTQLLADIVTPSCHYGFSTKH